MLRADRRRPLRLGIAWPLTVMAVGYPLWWLLGIASFLPAVAAVVMALQLRGRQVRAPRSALLWIAFLIWVVLSAATLGSTAPGAVPDSLGFGRLMVWGYGLTMYAAAGVAALWVANHDRNELPFPTIARSIGWLYVWATLGGFLGILAPQLELTSALEAVLPGSLRSNSFVRSLVHPAVADIQSILGRAEARPRAPFPYANTWGSVMALSLPFFMLGWWKAPRRWQRLVVVPVLVASAVPIVYSLNRGLWGCLAVGIVYVVVTLARRGKMAALGVAMVLTMIGALAFVASPLGDLVTQRFENQHSNDRREQLMVETVKSAAEGSPIVGFGGTRDVQGSFASIAGGATPECPACGVPPLGTQGHLWMVVFTQGLVGAAFFLAFLAIALSHALRGRSLPTQVSALILIFFFIQMLVYDTLGLPLMIVLASVGLVWREGIGNSPPLRALIAPFAARRGLIAGLAIAGLIAGVAAAFVPEPRYEASVRVRLIDTPSYLPVSLAERAPRRITIDTEAALVVSQQTLAAVADTAEGQRDIRSRLSITAVPTTQVLVISLSGSRPQGLAEMVDEVTQAYLKTRQAHLRNRQAQVLAVLYERLAQLSTFGGAESDEVVAAIDDNLRTTTHAGEVIGSSMPRMIPRDFNKFGVSGLAVALLLGCVISACRKKNDAQLRSSSCQGSREMIPGSSLGLAAKLVVRRCVGS